jgi:hypothetical protein
MLFMLNLTLIAMCTARTAPFTLRTKGNAGQPWSRHGFHVVVSLNKQLWACLVQAKLLGLPRGQLPDPTMRFTKVMIPNDEPLRSGYEQHRGTVWRLVYHHSSAKEDEDSTEPRRRLQDPHFGPFNCGMW